MSARRQPYFKKRIPFSGHRLVDMSKPATVRHGFFFESQHLKQQTTALGDESAGALVDFSWVAPTTTWDEWKEHYISYKMLKRELGADGRGDPVIRHIFRITSQARQSLGELSPAEISLTDRVRATTSPRGSAARDGSHGPGQRRAQRSWASRLYRAPLTVDVLPRLLRGLRAGAMSASSSSFSSSSSSPPSSSDQQQVRPSSAACPRDGSPAARVVRTVPLDSYPLSTYLSSRVLGWLDQTACDIVRPYAFTTHGETHQDQPAQPPLAATTNVALYYCVQERCVDATASSSACFSRDLSGWEVAPCDEDGQAEENLPPPLHAALPFSMLRAVEQPSSAQQQQGGGASSEPAPPCSPQHASVAVATVGHLIETMRGITGAFPYNP